MSIKDELIDNLKSLGIENLTDESIDIDDFEIVIERYAEIEKIIDAPHPVKDFILAMPEEANMAEYLSTYCEGVEAVEQWIIGISTNVAEHTLSLLTESLDVEQQYLADFLDSGDYDSYFLKADLSKEYRLIFQEFWQAFTRNEPHCEIPIFLAIACLLKGLKNSAKTFLFKWASSIWFYETNLELTLKEAIAIQTKKIGVSEKNKKAAKAKWEPKYKVEKDVCKLRYSDKYKSLSDRGAAKALVEIARDLGEIHGFRLSIDDDSVKQTLRNWFRANRSDFQI